MIKVYYTGSFQRELISMLGNFNSLQKPSQMSERKCLAVFLNDNKWSLAQCSNLLSTFHLVGKCQFCGFNEITVSSYVD